MKCFQLLILLISVSFSIQSQSLEAEEWVESILANQEEDAELDLNTILDQINAYLDRPFNLNKADRQQLEELFFLSDLEIKAILAHRKAYGNFLSVLELQSVPGLSVDKIRLLNQISKTSVLTTSSIADNTLRDQKHELYLKWRRILEDQRGYSENTTSPYLGDPNKLYMRYKYTSGRKIQMGLTAEKDAGEEFFRGSNKQGFDYYSAHLQLNDPIQNVRQVILGDYSLSLGQGLVAAMGFGTGKSAQVMRVKNRSKALRPYTSVNEFNYMRGLAVHFHLSSKFDLIAFGSFQNRDANFFQDTTDNEIFTTFTSLPVDGFHRNQNEIRKENQTSSFDAGGSLQFQNDRLNLNLNLLSSNFGNNFDRQPQLYQKYSILQRNYLNSSIDYSFIWKNFNFFGETAVDAELDIATLNGLIIGLDKNLEVSLVYRNLSPRYQSIYANTFTEASTAQNEEGFYVSGILRLSRSIQVHGYADLFRHPWLRFRIDSPSKGREYFLKFIHHRKRKSDFYFQYFFEEKELNNNVELSKTRQVLPTHRHRFRIHNSYKLNQSFEIRNRLEFSHFRNGDIRSNGFMIYQDLIIKPKNFPISATVRYALFDTDDFNSRIYAYENDLLYEFSIPAYAYRGSRTYINLRYRINRILTAELRWSQTYLTNRETIGSALELIDGNRRTDVKAQLRFKF